MKLVEIIIVLVVALIVFGPEELPKIARSLGKGIYQIRKLWQGFSQDFNNIIQEPVDEVKKEVKSINVESLLHYEDLTGEGTEAPAQQGARQAVNPLEALPQELVRDKRGDKGPDKIG
jgi:Tat protein translocase TatB subunit